MSSLDRQARSQANSASDYLSEQAADARMAIGRTLRGIRDNVSGLLGIRPCALRHPWIASGSAAAVGLVTGVLISPRKRKRRGSKRHATQTHEAPAPNRPPETQRATRAALFSFAGTVLAAILPPLFQKWLTPVDGRTQPVESDGARTTGQSRRDSAAPPG